MRRSPKRPLAVSQEAAFSIPLPEQVMHVKWNYVGSLLAITCKALCFREGMRSGKGGGFTQPEA